MCTKRERAAADYALEGNRMAIVTEQIGLFPLGAVLFPGAILPLHIYERRYQQLLRECIEHQQPFGVNLFEDGDLHLVGCTARVRGVLRHYKDGRFDVLVNGERRYVLQSFDDESKAYLIGTIEYLDDRADSTISTELYRQCVTLYNQLVERAFPGAQRYTLPPDRIPQLEGTTPSFVMAQKAGLNLMQKQMLLSLQSEDDRLEFLIKHLSELLPQLDRIEALMRVIRHDGYFVPQPPHKG